MDNLIRSDQGATSFILKVANSAMYCRGKHISNIPHAISLLGINIIRSLAVLSVSRTIFTQKRNDLIQKHVWQHSLLTALTCQQICLKMGEKKLAEEAFVAGLLHDIGKVLLYYTCSHDYPEILSYALEQPCTCAEAEQRFLDIDHNDVGKQAIVEWKLPEHFTNYTGINLESLTHDRNQSQLIQFLAIANSFVKGAGYGANLMELAERKEKLMNLGADDELSDFLLEETFIQRLVQSEIYLNSFG